MRYWPVQPPANRHKGPVPEPPPATFAPDDERLLDEIEHTSFLYFWEQANPQTGLIKDRCNARTNDTGVVGSIASTGFGLTAICIAEKRGFIPHEEARLRVLATLTFLWRTCPRIADSSITLPTSIPAKGFGTLKSPPSIRRSCFAAS